MSVDKKIGVIANGVNIDHIPQGKAWYIIKYLNLKQQYPVGIGLNLLSKKMGSKDLVKIENYYPSETQLSAISVFAPHATFSEIKDNQIINKKQLTIPDIIENLIICPNHRCISHQYKSIFKSSTRLDQIMVTCHYCNHSYNLKSLTKFNL